MTARQLIDQYIGSLPDWSKEICLILRKNIHKADPEIELERKVAKLNHPKGVIRAFLILFKTSSFVKTASDS